MGEGGFRVGRGKGGLRWELRHLGWGKIFGGKRGFSVGWEALGVEKEDLELKKEILCGKRGFQVGREGFGVGRGYLG